MRQKDERGWEYVTIEGERVYTDRLRDRPAVKPLPPYQPGRYGEGNGFSSRGQVAVVVDDGPDPRGPLSCREISELVIAPVATLAVLGRPGLILEGGTNLIYSYPKVGKTELVTALCSKWADDGKKILYLSEEPFGNWKLRLAAHNCRTIDTWRFYYALGCDLSTILCIIDQEECDIVVVDTLRNAVGFVESEGDKDVARVLHPLVAATEGKTLVCAYHANKTGGEGGRDISGHHSLYGVFDRALRLTPVKGHDRQRKLTASGRCMYEGDRDLVYEMTAPGTFRALDAEAVAGPVVRRIECANPGCERLFAREDPRQKFCEPSCGKKARNDLRFPGLQRGENVDGE